MEHTMLLYFSFEFRAKQLKKQQQQQYKEKKKYTPNDQISSENDWHTHEHINTLCI